MKKHTIVLSAVYKIQPKKSITLKTSACRTVHLSLISNFRFSLQKQHIMKQTVMRINKMMVLS